MTSSSSPPELLLQQTRKIVQALKQFNWTFGKESVTFAIVMDDKIVKMTLPKTIVIRESDASLEAMIFAYMSGETIQ